MIVNWKKAHDSYFLQHAIKFHVGKKTFLCLSQISFLNPSEHNANKLKCIHDDDLVNDREKIRDFK